MIDKLTYALNQPLPGPEAQHRLAVSGRDVYAGIEYTEAAVLILLLPFKSRSFPLIHRVDDGYPHGGQISLPGGKLEAGESLEECALRECEEEIGIPSADVSIIGRLTPLPVPVSRFIVQPIIGTINYNPAFTPNPDEVQDVFTVRLADLLNDDLRGFEQRSLLGQNFDVPFFRFSNHKVWGATAMILSEFQTILHDIS